MSALTSKHSGISHRAPEKANGEIATVRFVLELFDRVSRAARSRNHLTFDLSYYEEKINLTGDSTPTSIVQSCLLDLLVEVRESMTSVKFHLHSAAHQ